MPQRKKSAERTESTPAKKTVSPARRAARLLKEPQTIQRHFTAGEVAVIVRLKGVQEQPVVGAREVCLGATVREDSDRGRLYRHIIAEGGRVFVAEEIK